MTVANDNGSAAMFVVAASDSVPWKLYIEFLLE